MRAALPLLGLCVGILSGFSASVHAESASGTVQFETEVFVSGLEMPWSIAWLPGGDILVTERPGRLRIVRDGALLPEPVAGVPPVYFSSQGGLLDVKPHPDFGENGLVYLSFSTGRRGANALRIVRALYTGASLEDLETVYTAEPMKDTPVHFGGRMVFLPDGTLVATTGDGFDYREKAQDLSSSLGKTVRLTDDGGVPPDNPFTGQASALPEIYTYGHRNPQGLVYDGPSGRLYEAEFGPRGGDEINILKAGANYGWPIATYGIDYSGANITPYKDYPGTEQPLVHWTPAISPSGFAVYRGQMFPEWDGDLFVSSLSGRHVRHIDLENGAAANQTELLKDLGKRIRDVQVGPDGALYVLTDDSHGDEADPGEVLRIYR